MQHWGWYVVVAYAALCLSAWVACRRYARWYFSRAEHLDQPTKNPKAEESWRRSDWTKVVEL